MATLKSLILSGVVVVASSGIASAHHSEQDLEAAKTAAVDVAKHASMLRELRMELAESLRRESESFFTSVLAKGALTRARGSSKLSSATRNVDRLQAAIESAEEAYTLLKSKADTRYQMVRANLHAHTRMLASRPHPSPVPQIHPTVDASTVAKPVATTAVLEPEVVEPAAVMPFAIEPLRVIDHARIDAVTVEIAGIRAEYDDIQVRLAKLVKAATAIQGTKAQRAALIKAMHQTKEAGDKLARELAGKNAELAAARVPTTRELVFKQQQPVATEAVAEAETAMTPSARPRAPSALGGFFSALARPFTGSRRNVPDVDFQPPAGMRPGMVVAKYKGEREAARELVKLAKSSFDLVKRERSKAREMMVRKEKAVFKLQEQAEQAVSRSYAIAEHAKWISTEKERSEWAKMVLETKRHGKKIDRQLLIAQATLKAARQAFSNWDHQVALNTARVKQAETAFDTARALYAAARKWRATQTSGTVRDHSGAM
ncbi:MAG: hypothetical protein QGF67_13130 [Lentisphaeria bacterium]|nr:hypothetical protein [Lentisphaeria bacterium]MDP7742378.1 hypothetical protein [Lentisphaeria bacterium]